MDKLLVAIRGRGGHQGGAGSRRSSRRALRLVISVALVGALLVSSTVDPPRASAGGTGLDLGANGQHRRPFYNFGHNPNELGEVSDDLAAGANALEPDVMRFSDAAITDGGANINATAGPSGLFIYHDHVAVTTRMPTTLERYLDSIHNRVLAGTNVAMIAFDIKSAAANEFRGAKLLEAVRTHLNHSGVRVNVIYSVATFGDTSVFNQIIPRLGPREGVMIDSENDPGAVYNYLVAHGASGHIGYGNGSIGFRYGFAPNVLNGIEAASWIRAAHGAALAIPYAFPMDLASDMNALITAGADGLIPDRDAPVTFGFDTTEHIRTLAAIVNRRDDIYLATAADDPFHPRVEAYALRVNTRDKFGAGTNSNLTFTLTGCNGTSSVTVDSSFRLHMESGDVNYVTLPSKDLGSLRSLRLSSDGSGLGSSWDPGLIEISSAGWGIPYGDHRGVTFSSSVDEDSPQTRDLGGWGHRCDPGIEARGAPFSATEGLTFSGEVASFTDADAGASAAEYAATVSWGDGTPSSTGTVSGPVNGRFSVRGTHRYAEEGGTIAAITILDTESGVIHLAANPMTVFSGVTVRDAPLTASAVPVAATEGAPFSARVATFTDADPAGTVSDYTARIDWGDGSAPSAGTVSAVGGAFAVGGIHTYAEEGSFRVTVRVTDVGGAAATSVVTATVADAALAAVSLPVAATEGAPFAGRVATFTDADPAGTVSDYTAQIDWGDGTASSPGTVSALGTGFGVGGTHTYAEEGSFRVTVRVLDVGGANTTSIGTASVADAALAATGRTVYTTNPVSEVALATFTDADPAGTVSDYRATIDWSDGSPPSAGTVSGPDGGPFTVAGSHTYASTGPFNRAVRLRICDIGGSCADTTSVVKLLYMTGRSTALQSKLSLPLLAGQAQGVSDTGEVANTGVTSTSRTLVGTPPGPVQASALAASVQTIVGRSVARSSASQVRVSAPLIPAIVIQGASSTATTTCAGSTGASQIAALTIGGRPVATAGAGANSRVELGSVTVVLNEQKAVEGGLEVNAVHVTIAGVLDLVVSSSRSDIHNCPPP